MAFPFILLNTTALRYFDDKFEIFDNANVSPERQLPLKVLLARLIRREISLPEFYAGWTAITHQVHPEWLQTALEESVADVGPHLLPPPVPKGTIMHIDHNVALFFQQLKDDNPHCIEDIREEIRDLFNGLNTPAGFLQRIRAFPSITIREHHVPSNAQISRSLYWSLRARMIRTRFYARDLESRDQQIGAYAI